VIIHSNAVENWTECTEVYEIQDDGHISKVLLDVIAVLYLLHLDLTR
jgi:hypothetical protein